MDYLTKYYKNLVEQLQQKIVILESQLNEVKIYDQSKNQGIKDVQSFGQIRGISDQRRVIPTGENISSNSNFNPLIDDRYTTTPTNNTSGGNALSAPVNQQPQQNENPLASDDRYTGNFEGEERETLGMPQMRQGRPQRTTAEMLLGKKPVIESYARALRSKNPDAMKKEMMRQMAKSAARTGLGPSESEESKITELRLARNEVLSPDFESETLHPDMMSDPQQREMMSDIQSAVFAQDTVNKFIQSFERDQTERKKMKLVKNHDTNPTDSVPVYGTKA